MLTPEHLLGPDASQAAEPGVQRQGPRGPAPAGVCPCSERGLGFPCHGVQTPLHPSWGTAGCTDAIPCGLVRVPKGPWKTWAHRLSVGGGNGSRVALTAPRPHCVWIAPGGHLSVAPNLEVTLTHHSPEGFLGEGRAMGGPTGPRGAPPFRMACAGHYLIPPGAARPQASRLHADCAACPPATSDGTQNR